mmetsp:Transcript_3909/g.11347  ORF Transcript_3909/g.11347 Transcript_3909/m.11347 type:complete len:385 (-) Transcript_3909:471-1625(-)
MGGSREGFASAGSTRQLIVLGAGLFITACVVLIITSGGSNDNQYALSDAPASAGVLGRLRARVKGLSSQEPNCRLEFLGYEPSAWEKTWRENADKLKDKICVTMLEGKDRDLTDAWMEGMPDVYGNGNSGAVSDSPRFKDTTVWSQYLYRNTCGGEVRQPIEPLVGLFRHPTSHPACARADHPEYIDHQHNGGGGGSVIENKGYMVLQPLANDTIATLYPGRKYLFDLGTGTWNSGSIPWLTQWYGQKGVVFDEIWGWELTAQNITDYWQQFPAEMSEKMHFRNVGVNFAADAPDNPLNIVRRIFRKGDYVAIKLDIDNAPIEQALMDQLDDEVVSMIGEFFFEQHYDCPEMSPYFGGTGVGYSEVYERFHKIRSRGLRIHYWP